MCYILYCTVHLLYMYCSCWSELNCGGVCFDFDDELYNEFDMYIHLNHLRWLFHSDITEVVSILLENSLYGYHFVVLKVSPTFLSTIKSHTKALWPEEVYFLWLGIKCVKYPLLGLSFINSSL